MAIDIHKLIAAISPDVYCKNKDEVKKILQEENSKYESEVKKLMASGVNEKNAKSVAKNDSYIKAAEKAEPKSYEGVDFNNKLAFRNITSYKDAFKYPIEQHKVSYDAPSESLEPIYFWILDTVKNFGFVNPEKLVDNFASTVGSGHFSEMGMKLSRMQEEGMKMLGSANQVVKSILNIIYDLKEFNLRLGLYDTLKSEKASEKVAALISLKQVWLDTVDQKRGNSSIKAMALTQANFVTLIDAFMAAEDESLTMTDKEGNKIPIDLNDRVSRILKQRVLEFNLWIKESEKELRKRFEIEKNYLRSQYNTVQMYARWIKPYLVAAKQLEQHSTSPTDLVNMFNTTILELTLMAKGGAYDPSDEVFNKDLPLTFKDLKQQKNYKAYTPLMIIELKYRSIPEKSGQNYGFRGRANITFTSYCLSKKEIDLVKQQVDKDNFGDVMQMISGATDDSLAQLKEDVDLFLYNKTDDKNKGDSYSKEDNVNPFKELVSFFWKDEKKPNVEDTKETEIDKVIRGLGILDARKRCVKIYEIFKKANRMPAFSTVE